MKLTATILLLLFAWTSSIAFATDDDPEKDKTIKSSRDFSLRCRSLGNTDPIEKRMSVKVYTAYNSKDQEIKININKNTDSSETFTLKYPLDFEVFIQKFDSLFNEVKDDSLFVFYGSHLDVFYWIVTITEDSNLPLAGTLTTGQYVMVSSTNNGQDQSHTERTKLVKNEIDSLDIKRAKLQNIEVKLKKLSYPAKTTLTKDSSITQKAITEAKTNLKQLTSDLDDIKSKLAKPNVKEGIKLKADSIATEDKIKKEQDKLTDLTSKLSEINTVLSESDNNRKATLKALKSDSVQTQKAIISQFIRIENLNIRKVSHVQYQFEKGYLEKIQVYIESPGTENIEIFENSYPIGFSSISNYRNFTGTRLFRRSSKFENDVKDNYIFLSDIIKLYANELNLATRDYSPGDTTVTIFPSSNPIVRLTKQNSFYIIDGKTFTDVTGLSEDSPNGLVQVELSRRFNLWTHRVQVRSSNNFGCVNYVNAKVNFSKIENKLKGLPLRNQLIVENNSIVSPSYATNLDYLRYENLGITMDVNTFLFDAPDFKYTLFIDAGIHYGHTPIIDSVYEISQGVATTTSNEPNKLDAHNFTFFPRVKVQLFAERRYGLSLSYQANYTWLFTNNRFKQVLSYSGKGQDLNSLSTNQSAHWSHMIEAAFYVDVNPTSSTGKIFTTARFFFQQGDVNTFYPQILLGYAFNIVK